jgi:CBS domain-containing protein
MFIYTQDEEKIMSRYRDDDETQGGYGGGVRGGRSGWGSEERFESERGDYGGRAERPRVRDSRDYGYDDSYGAQQNRPIGGGGGVGSGGGGRDYGQGRGGGENYGQREERYGQRGDYGADESRYGGGGGSGYSDTGRLDERDDDAGGRSLYEEGRDYLQQRFGRRRGSAGRGGSRSRVRCRDIMTRDVTVATRDTTLEEVARMMKEEDTGVIPVVDTQNNPTTATDAGVVEEARRVNTRMYGNGRLIGLITDRDIVIRAAAEGKDFRTTRAEEVMTTDVHTAKPNDRVIEAIRKMGDKQVRRIPVVGDNGNLRGIISMADVALETEEDQELADALEEISSGASFWGKVFG